MADLRFLAGLSGGIKGFSEGRERRRLIEEKEAEKRLEQARRELGVLERESDRKREDQRFEEEFALKKRADVRAQTAADVPEPIQALFDPTTESFRQAPPGVNIKGSVSRPIAEAAQRETPEEKTLSKLCQAGSDAACNALFALQGTKLKATKEFPGGGIGEFFGAEGDLVIKPLEEPGLIKEPEQGRVASFFSSVLQGGKKIIGQESQTVTIQTSDGQTLTIPSENLEKARQRDPGLVVIQ